MIFKLCFLLEIFLIAHSTSFQLKSKFGSLAAEINKEASKAGIGPIAEVEGDGLVMEDFEDDSEGFDINRAKSIQDIKSLKELRDMQEITAMKEIKSIQEVPDDIADKFISEHNLQPIDSIDDEPEEEEEEEEEEEDSPEAKSLEIIENSQGGCGERIEEMELILENLKSLAGDMVELIASLDLSKSNQREVEVDESSEAMSIEEDIAEESAEIGLPENEDIVNIEEIKNLEEIKSITPIKSIQEVVGIYPLTDELAMKLKELNGGRFYWRKR